jgi:uncharacterized protein (DUF302 family)
MAPEGVVTIASAYSPEETVERFKAGLVAHGLDLFAQIDHAQNAKEAALTLPPETVLVFGSAAAGTPLMQASQAAAIDLPLKALVWRDAAGKTWIAYGDPVWIAKRHGLGAALTPIAGKMREGLEAIADEAAGSGQ